jgi:predicted small integral membrane protein
MKSVLVLAAVGEASTGVALLLVPSLVGQWLFGAELSGVGLTMTRVTGIALIALGIACWPGPALFGMLAYSTGAALYLAWIGLSGASSGVLLWPAVVLDVILAALLIRSFAGGKPADPSRN